MRPFIAPVTQRVAGNQIVVPVPPVADTVEAQDMLTILAPLQEQLTVKRQTIVYDGSGRVIKGTWPIVAVIYGDWQPVSGTTVIEESGLKEKSEAKVILPASYVLYNNDRLEKDDGTFMYINYVKRYRSHITVFLKRTESSE